MEVSSRERDVDEEGKKQKERQKENCFAVSFCNVYSCPSLSCACHHKDKFSTNWNAQLMTTMMITILIFCKRGPQLKYTTVLHVSHCCCVSLGKSERFNVKLNPNQWENK